MIIPDRAVSVNPFSQTFSKTLRISMIIAKEGHMPFTLSPQQRVSGSADTAARRWRWDWPSPRPRGVGAHRQGQKGTGHHMVSAVAHYPLSRAVRGLNEY